MKKLYGVTVAMVTPFDENDQVDLAAMKELTNMLTDKGVNCLYPCGTTGEMLRMSLEERKAVAKAVVETAAGRVTVYIHCGAMRQEDTIALIHHAKSIGADGAGVVSPQFFGANEREMIEYYRAVASCEPDFPIYLYNIPQCAGNDISASAAEVLAAECSNIIGIKYSYPDINRTIDYTAVHNGRFSVLHGLDRAFVSLLALGCDGTVSGIACVFPEPFVKVFDAYQSGDLQAAQQLQKVCIRFCDTLKRGSNMSYFKEALKMRGLNAGFMRKPQLDLEAAEIQQLRSELMSICENAGIVPKIR